MNEFAGKTINDKPENKQELVPRCLLYQLV